MPWNRVPLIGGLECYTEENNRRFHMPGHRNEEALPELRFLRERLYAYDVTEVPGTDNLHHAEGILKESEVLLTKALGAGESHYCVNGSTAVNYAMIHGLFQPGDVVLVQRNCHQSVYNALAMARLTPQYLLPEVDPTFLLPTGVSLKTVIQAYAEHPEAKGVILTSPSYYGTVTDLQAISAFVREQGLLLLVDEAHGAHFPFSPLLPKSAMAQGAHASAVSFHKTLPSLTQGAVLNLSADLSPLQRERVRHWLRIFQTTSPSYTLLASMEMARHLMETQGEARIEALILRLDALKAALREVPGLQVMDGEALDPTRLILRTPFPGAEVDAWLRRVHHIQAEMSEGQNLVFLLSPFDAPESWDALEAALKNLPSAAAAFSPAAKTSPLALTLPVRVLPEEEVLFLPAEEVPFSQAEGRICAERIIPYPPGVPLILPGERISKEILNSLQTLLSSGHPINRTKSAQEDHLWVVTK